MLTMCVYDPSNHDSKRLLLTVALERRRVSASTVES